jgi:hypothetical protein
LPSSNGTPVAVAISAVVSRVHGSGRSEPAAGLELWSPVGVDVALVAPPPVDAAAEVPLDPPAPEHPASARAASRTSGHPVRVRAVITTSFGDGSALRLGPRGFGSSR